LIVNEFNNVYAVEKGLNIRVELEILTPETSSTVIENYGTTIESFLKKRSKRNDIYFYYSAYSRKYGEHFIDLRKYLSEEDLQGYDEDIFREACTSTDGKLVGLPIYIYITTLYSNQTLLTKYGKDIPKTWDELMSTSKYIYDEEKKQNNTIIRYHSSINDYNGSMSLFEFINSFRESNESPQPEIRSKTTVKALEKLKEMKDEIGEEIFKESDDDAMFALYGMESPNTYLFSRFFFTFYDPSFTPSALPGAKEGVSGTIVIPNNIAVSKYIDDDRKEAAIEFVKFVASKDVQKRFIINGFMYSANMDLYENEEVCSVLNCDVVRNSYPFSFMSNDIKFFCDDNYHIKYRNTIFKYLYGNEPIDKVLKELDDVTRVYKYSTDTEVSNVGLTMFIIFLVCITIVFLSLIFVFIKPFEKRFKFLSKDLWVITTLGSLILMSSVLTLYGNASSSICQLRTTLINVGFVLSVCPSFLKLIINFPESNKISSWIQKNVYYCILIIVVLTAGLNGLLAISPYTLKEDRTTDELKINYKKCVMNKTFGSILYYLIQCYDILIILLSLLLIFMEWNLKRTSLDVKYLATALFMDILSLILLNIIDKIKFSTFVIYNALLTITILFFSISNHVFIYFIRILPIFGNDGELEESRKILGKVSNSGMIDSKKASAVFTSSNHSTSKNSRNDRTAGSHTSSTQGSKIASITNKIMSYHNQTS